MRDHFTRAYPDKELLSHWSLQFADYQKRSKSTDADIKYCRVHKKTCAPDMVAWIQFMDIVKKIQDPYQKAAAINGWVNARIAYDHAPKEDTVDNFYQTAKETLEKGTGICGDQALLNYETAKRVGFSEQDLELVGLSSEVHGKGRYIDTISFGYHAVTSISINGESWILNNQQMPEALSPKKPNRDIALAKMSAMENAKAAFTPNHLFIWWEKGTPGHTIVPNDNPVPVWSSRNLVSHTALSSPTAPLPQQSAASRPSHIQLNVHSNFGTAVLALASSQP